MTIIEVDEYQTIRVPGLRPSPADRDLAFSPELRKRVELRWLADGDLEITASSHVGVVSLDCASIHIKPKLVGRELAVLRMLDYASGLPALHHLETTRDLPGTGPHLRDLVCLLLTIECEALLRHGLRRDYVRREDSLPALRGRLLHDRQLLRRFGQLDRLECRFDEFDANILDNQLCAAALNLAARTSADETIRARARRAATEFSDLCPTAVVDHQLAAQTLTYHRHNEHYRQAHRWASLLLGHGGLADLYETSGPSGQAFLLDLNSLFEAFVTRLLEEAFHGTGIAVRTQPALKESVAYRDGRRYTTIMPDIQLTRGHGQTAWRRPVDVKYKLYTDRKIKPADLYQSFAYATALSRVGSNETPTAYILYASDRDTTPEEVILRRYDGSTAAQITALGLNVPSLIAALGTPQLMPALAGIRTAVTSGKPAPQITR
ncbi:McrC family protein [Nonomuraea bangladeshensis]|uniref:McrC family protein n=1 Tax=Nonomuraea bangladeshensis TaxID=404385 RepID=UPI0031DA66AE